MSAIVTVVDDESTGDDADESSQETGDNTGKGGDGQPQSNNKRKRPRVGPVQFVDGYEKVMLEDGGFRKRRVGAKQWQRHCNHGRRRSTCKECGGAASFFSSLCSVDFSGCASFFS